MGEGAELRIFLDKNVKPGQQITLIFKVVTHNAIQVSHHIHADTEVELSIPNRKL